MTQHKSTPDFPCQETKEYGANAYPFSGVLFCFLLPKQRKQNTQSWRGAMVAQLPCNQQVVGSNPIASSEYLIALKSKLFSNVANYDFKLSPKLLLTLEFEEWALGY